MRPAVQFLNDPRLRGCLSLSPKIANCIDIGHEGRLQIPFLPLHSKRNCLCVDKGKLHKYRWRLDRQGQIAHLVHNHTTLPNIVVVSNTIYDTGLHRKQCLRLNAKQENLRLSK